MSNLTYADVPVAGTTIPSFELDGEVFIPLRNVSEKLGLAWQNEHRRIRNDPILSKAVIKLMTALSNSQEQLCLPLKFFPGWVFKINLNGVSDEARPTVEAVQLEGYDALYSYWVKGVAVNPRAAASIEHSDRTSRRRELPALLDRYEAEFNPEKRRILYELIVRACEAEGINPPEPDAIRPINRSEEQAMALLAKIEARIADDSLTNHHRREDRLAFSMPELRKIGAGVDRDQMAALKRHPRFLANCPVNCRDGQTRSLWVFLAA
jgi:P22_AR N-terminal domain